jgi:hypothetical protein
MTTEAVIEFVTEYPIITTGRDLIVKTIKKKDEVLDEMRHMART